MVEKAKSYSNSPVVQLPKTDRLYKFSVVSSELDCQFVHIFFGQNQRWYVKCLSKICVPQHGKKMLVSALFTECNICRHLAVMKSYPALWRDKCNLDEDDKFEDVDYEGHGNSDDDYDEYVMDENIIDENTVATPTIDLEESCIKVSSFLCFFMYSLCFS